MAAELSGANRALLGNTFLFRDAGTEPLEAALADGRCALATAGKGETIYSPHDYRRCLAVLLEGAVQVSQEGLIISVLAPGDLFGAAALFNTREDYAVTLTAKAPCRVLLLPQDMVEELMARFPAVGLRYVAYLSDRIRFLNEKIGALLAGSAERKLAQHLLDHVRDGQVLLGCTAAELAQRLNVSRASLYRAFDALTLAGLIVRQGREIQVLNLEALRQI